MQLTRLKSSVTIQTWLLSSSYLTPPLSFTSPKACKLLQSYSHNYTHTILSCTHSFMFLFPPKLPILYTTSPALLTLYTTSSKQQARTTTETDEDRLTLGTSELAAPLQLTTPESEHRTWYFSHATSWLPNTWRLQRSPQTRVQSLNRPVSPVSGLAFRKRRTVERRQSPQVLPTQLLWQKTDYLTVGKDCWLERWTRGRKVASSNPGKRGGRIFFFRVNFCVLTLIRCPFHPRVTAVARKRPWSFCQKCRWQISPKHAYTLDPKKSEWADYTAVQA